MTTNNHFNLKSRRNLINVYVEGPWQQNPFSCGEDRQRGGRAHLLVEGHRVSEEGVDDVWVVVELLMHHQGEDAHLGGTAVVQFNGELFVEHQSKDPKDPRIQEEVVLQSQSRRTS